MSDKVITFKVDPSKLFDAIAAVGDGGASVGLRVAEALLMAGQPLSWPTEVELAVYGISVEEPTP